MDKNKIIKGVDDFAAAKRSSVIAVRMALLFALLVIVGVLIFAGVIIKGSINNILVVDASTGLYLSKEQMDDKKLFLVRIKTQCAMMADFANSFDRMNVKENYAKALFLCNKGDVDRIVQWYLDRNAYRSALLKGVVYKTTFQRLDSLHIDDDGYYRVAFSSIVHIDEDGNDKGGYTISSNGKLRKQTPQHPENKTGLYFIEYNQTWKPLKNEQ